MRRKLFGVIAIGVFFPQLMFGYFTYKLNMDLTLTLHFRFMGKIKKEKNIFQRERRSGLPLFEAER